MHTQAFILAALSFMVTLEANPVEKIGDIQSRDTAPTTGDIRWNNTQPGNIQVGWADQGLKFGGVKPSTYINNNVTSMCSPVGTCQDGINVAFPKVTLYDENNVEALDVTMTVTGDYAPSHRDGLLEMLAFALDNQTTTTNACGVPFDTSGCPSGACLLPQKECGDMYTAPGSVAVVLTGDYAPNDTTPGYINVQFDIEDAAAGLCSTMTTTGAGLSGFIGEASGPVGGLFTLASLFCNS